MSKNIINIFFKSLFEIFQVWKREFRLVFRDEGVVIFFFALPIMYPIAYSLIYNPELAREIPVVIVDDCRSEISREYTRELNATEGLRVANYAPNLQEAKRMMDEKECYGIIHFPYDFSQKVGRGETATLELYCEMSLLLRYKSLLISATNVSQHMGAKVQLEKMKDLPIASIIAPGGETTAPIPSKLTPVGNTSMGLASAILPGILILILQQSIVLAVCLLCSTSRERARRNNGYDPQQIRTGVFNSMIGKSLCYFIIMIVPTIYILHYVPIFFSFPQDGISLELFVFVIPFLFASIFFGMTLQVFVHDREATFLVVVFSSVIFLFLSGLSWPRYAMSTMWHLSGDVIPATWAVNGYVSMKTDGATLAQQREPYLMLWLLTAAYFIISFVIIKYIQRPQLRKLRDMNS